MVQDWNIILQRTLQEGNFCVDWLENKGTVENHSLIILTSCPIDLDRMIFADYRNYYF
uniref:Uncharacterized protein n=1 Tax=Cajanus cajan TaxID=3821 RepID=A0A151QN99_CAJCA|nr:hypothetical protein KK1_047746 [Cajanus cajan]